MSRADEQVVSLRVEGDGTGGVGVGTHARGAGGLRAVDHVVEVQVAVLRRRHQDAVAWVVLEVVHSAAVVRVTTKGALGRALALEQRLREG